MGKTPHLTASKVLEKVVCIQMTEFLEKNNLLPKSQHGFRAKHSTMTAHSNMQTDWVENSENGLKTGLLIWDLSAAFDTLDIQLLCEKLKLYGFSEETIKWFKSFLTGRTQRVRIGQSLSEAAILLSGVPQGGIKCAQESFTIDTARLWNRAPLAITNATSLQTAKNCIKRHCKEMPI